MENDKVNIFEWENWDKLSVDTAQFILGQAEKELSELIVAADVLTQRSSTIMQASFAVLIGLIGYSVSKPESDIGIKLAVVSCVFLIVISFLSFRIYRLYKVKPMGNRPSKMVTEEKTNHDKQHLVYIYNSIKTTEKSIVFNEIENGKRVRELKLVFYLIWLWLLVSVCCLIWLLCRP